MGGRKKKKKKHKRGKQVVSFDRKKNCTYDCLSFCGQLFLVS